MMKEQANIKLFGTKILLQVSGRGIADREYSGESCVDSSNGSGGAAAAVDSDTCPDFSRGKKRRGDVQENQVEQHHQDHQEGETNPDQINHRATDEQRRANTSSNSDINPRSENEQSNSSTTQNALNKPDKITLSCPRCNSSDTKFCYYNNYNISQPRHFCKGCQRYWTDGGTTRNVPVGAGRRKNYYISKAQMELGPPMCESIASGVNPNGFQYPFVPFPYPNVYPMPYYYTPCLSSSVVQHPKASQKEDTGTTGSSTNGKHSRNGDFIKKKGQLLNLD